MDKKDQLISNLRAEVFELKKAEKGQRLLDLQINELQTHLTLLHDEKERADKEQKLRLNEDSQAILELRREIDLVKAEIERTVLLNQDKANSVLKLKKMSETRANEIQLIKKDCINVESRNRTLFDENKSLALTTKALREERADIESDIEALEELIARNAGLIKQREKELRDKDCEIAKLTKIIENMNAEYIRRIAISKEKSEEKEALLAELGAKEAQKHDMIRALSQLEEEREHWRAESERLELLYKNELAQSRELMQRKEYLEGQLREREIAIDEMKMCKSQEKEAHMRLCEDNETLNREVEKNLGLIMELSDINCELQKEIEIYTEEDENARAILDRKEKMKETLMRNRHELKATHNSIKHLLEAI